MIVKVYIWNWVQQKAHTDTVRCSPLARPYIVWRKVVRIDMEKRIRMYIRNKTKNVLMQETQGGITWAAGSSASVVANSCRSTSGWNGPSPTLLPPNGHVCYGKMSCLDQDTCNIHIHRVINLFVCRIYFVWLYLHWDFDLGRPSVTEFWDKRELRLASQQEQAY